MNSPSRTRIFLSAAALTLLVAATAGAQYPQQYQPPPSQYPAQQYPAQQYPSQYAAAPQGGYDNSYPQQYAPQQPVAAQQPLGADQLEQLVAPIALYPDALVAQILAGATYPAQLASADQWLHSSGFQSADQVAMGANAQTQWDPSVKALTAFPQVLDMLTGNLQWTTALGNAYYNQPQDVLQTVQVLRARAEQAGTLQSTPQEQVVASPGYISLQPVNPDVIYVPTYNPWLAYGAPVQPYPGFSFTGILSGLANAFLGGGFGGGYGGGYGAGGGGLQYLLSFALGAFNHTPFGLISWGLDWLGNLLTFHHDGYWTHSTTVADWGLPHGGPRYYPRAYPGNYPGGYRGGGQRPVFAGNYNHQPIAIHGGNGFAGNAMPGGRQPMPTRPVMPQQPMNRMMPQQAVNRMPQQPARPMTPYGNTFAARGQMPVMPARPANTYADAYRGMQMARPNVPSASYGNYGRAGQMAYAGGAQNFHQDRQAGVFGGGNSYKESKFSQPKFKEPKMSYKEPKMPKMSSPHESHGGGGHFGGGHSGGGHHH